MRLHYSYTLSRWISCMSIALLASGCVGNSFTHSLKQVPPPATLSSVTPDYSDSTMTVAVGEHYGRSRLHTFFYGKHYRSAWTTPVEFRVLDLSTEKGGLKPTSQGGSRQTMNLRLEDSTGKEYVLRSVDKDPATALPEKWQQSYAANIIRDATSATHPYAALVLPPMAKAIGIHHTEPQLVYVPHDPKLGKYLDNFGGMVALLEIRPDDDLSDEPDMGGSENVKGTRSMLEDRFFDNQTRIDARYFLRARLFDMLIGDWSRHEDNWRWAQYKENGVKVYQAIPRDRDNVFYKLNDAVIPWLFMRTGLKKHFQTYSNNLSNLTELNTSGRNLDETILAELTYQDWVEIADSVRNELTDDVIERAFRQMPDTIYKLTAKDIMTKLKSRRNKLTPSTQKYYKELVREALIVGSDKHERFEIEVLSTDEVRVQVHKVTKEGEEKRQLFDRVYHAADTKEIHLFGLNGKDEFEVTGDVRSKIKIRVWGGAGEDSYTVKGNKRMARRVWIEDTAYRNDYDLIKGTRKKIVQTPLANQFDAEGWLLRYYLN
ncbi:hypothetical protein H9Q13_12370 [Pontibacter sp. JH31]|uniref:Uncharacterized protein n=1 Tax=Pontibacter aquaedesilientis TaxID=2766980 RepID=A0ABR7XK09_9BACT|nr:hypothetical protein [Pontibacter aquaedesilientis]MBD1397963.1 hypothetical protein [Pontibacter aquaedesilientis]